MTYPIRLHSMFYYILYSKHNFWIGWRKYILIIYLQEQCADTLTSHTMQFVLEKERKKT